jgi:hypothetical protein
MSEPITQPAGDAVPSPSQPSGSTRKRGTLQTFLAGAAGAIMVYVVFWFRNQDVVLDSLDSPFTACVSGGCLLFIAAMAGFLAWGAGAMTLRAAFTTGLGLPGAIFAINLGAESATLGGDGDDGGSFDLAGAMEDHTGATEPTTRVEPQSFFDRMRLAIAPVSAVERHEALEARQAIDVVARDVQRMGGAMTQIAASLEQDGSMDREDLLRMADKTMQELSDPGVTILAHELENRPQAEQEFGLENINARPGPLPPQVRKPLRRLEEHGKSDRVKREAKRAQEKMNDRPPGP